jgi:hypothetical protein
MIVEGISYHGWLWVMGSMRLSEVEVWREGVENHLAP